MDWKALSEALGGMARAESGAHVLRGGRVRPGEGGVCRTRLGVSRWVLARSRSSAGRGLRAMVGRGAAALLVLLLVAPTAYAERVPKEGPQDPRIRTVVYNPRDVVKIEGTYGYHTVIELAESEVIQSLVIGDSVAWEAVQSESGSRIFLKPREERAATNLTVITDRRTYSFALVASRAKSSQRMTWRLRFSYPDEEAEQRQILAERAALREVSLVRPDAPRTPDQWNLRYSYAGSEALRPVQMFDDGEFTYLRFAERTTLPAVFVVDADKSESLVNARMSGEYLVVHRVVRQLALRRGPTLTCIFNDGYSAREGRGEPVNAPRPVEEVTASTDSDAAP